MRCHLCQEFLWIHNGFPALSSSLTHVALVASFEGKALVAAMLTLFWDALRSLLYHRKEEASLKVLKVPHLVSAFLKRGVSFKNGKTFPLVCLLFYDLGEVHDQIFFDCLIRIPGFCVRPSFLITFNVKVSPCKVSWRHHVHDRPFICNSNLVVPSIDRSQNYGKE